MTGGAGDDDRLAAVAAENPEYRIWREATWDGIRYVCRSRELHTSPHTMVTRSLEELAAELTAYHSSGSG